jgi:hypothetical protein
MEIIGQLRGCLDTNPHVTASQIKEENMSTSILSLSPPHLEDMVSLCSPH